LDYFLNKDGITIVSTNKNKKIKPFSKVRVIAPVKKIRHEK